MPKIITVDSILALPRKIGITLVEEKTSSYFDWSSDTMGVNWNDEICINNGLPKIMAFLHELGHATGARHLLCRRVCKEEPPIPRQVYWDEEIIAQTVACQVGDSLGDNFWNFTKQYCEMYTWESTDWPYIKREVEKALTLIEKSIK